MNGCKIQLFPHIFVRLMSDEKAIYWLTQVSGWFGYILLILFHNLLAGNVDSGIVKVLFVNFVIGVSVSHLLRGVIVHSGMLSMKILKVIPRIIGLSAAAGVVSAVLYAGISDLFFSDVPAILSPPFGLLVELIFPFATVYLFWSVLYFAAIFLKNYEREEVKNLRLTSSITEVELGNLRSQLNPHFMFNALNSIRALVDENPEQAKTSITQMSRILRGSLLAGKQNLVPLRDEAALTEDYLSLEKIRYEERLNYSVKIAPETARLGVPPVLLQTLAENAVKHGISNLPKGGEIKITSALGAEPGQEQCLKLSVTNTGVYSPGRKSKLNGASVGIANSRRRLNLLFGDDARLEIFGKDGYVTCLVTIPFHQNSERYENDSD